MNVKEIIAKVKDIELKISELHRELERAESELLRLETEELNLQPEEGEETIFDAHVPVLEEQLDVERYEIESEVRLLLCEKNDLTKKLEQCSMRRRRG